MGFGSISYMQIFLLADFFILGILISELFRHALAHFRKHPVAEPIHRPDPSDPIPEAVKERMLKVAVANYQQTLEKSVQQMNADLAEASDHIKAQTKRLATNVVGDELEHYRSELVEVRKKAIADLSGIEAELEKQRSTMKTNLEAEIAAEKERLIKQIDTKLGDAVASFLLETLQHNVDLGSQSTYLMKTLDDNADNFKKKVSDEV